MTEQVKVPEIRFAGFTDPWEQRKLGDVADLLTGYPFESRHFTDTGIPLVRGMNVKRGYLDMSADICENWSDAVGVEDYLLKAGDIVIQMDGALIGSSYAMVTPENTPSLLVQRVTRVRCGNRSRYIFQAVQRGFLRYIKSLKTETAVPHLSLSDIADYAIPVPKEEREQEHIGSFFSRLDDLITLHQRKYDKLVVFKKSMLEKMFPKDGESVPEIRFAGFTDPWEQRELGEFSKKNTIKNANGALSETFTNSAEQGVISQLDYFDHDITNDANISGYYVVQPDDFVYNPRISATAPCGPINRNRLNRAGVMSPLYTVFSVDASMDKTYLEHYFKTSRWHDFMFLEGNTGARSDRFSISDATFFEMPIWCPEISEQMAIAKQLETTDTLITLHQRKLELLQNIKKSLLDKMFV